MNYDFIYFMGDSYTWAMKQDDDINREINRQNRFSGLIGKHYNLPILNKALPGCSNFHIFKTVYDDIYKFVSQGKKILVVLSYTSPTRVDLFHNGRNKYQPISDLFSFYKEYVVESFNTNYCDDLSTQYILAIHTLLDKFNIDYVESYVWDPLLDVPYANKNRCLDKSLLEITQPEGRFNPTGHANILGNARIAEEFIKKIDQLYGTN